jgi:hypothetical protein
MAHSIGVNAELLGDSADLPVFGIEQVTNVSLSFPIEQLGASVSAIGINESPVSAANDAAEPAGEPSRPTLGANGCRTGDLQRHPEAESGTKGSFIRHGPPHTDDAAPSILALTVSMIEPSFGALLMAPVSEAPLLTIGLVATCRAAVTLSSVAMPANPEQLAASDTPANPLT